jgi:iron complex outermembrane recepter protein
MTRLYNSSGRNLATVLVTTSLGAAAATAWADTPVTTENQPVTLQEVVVTAEKRTSSIQDVPVSVSAVQGSQLVAEGLKSLTEYADYVPGLSINPSGAPGQTAIAIRGVAPIGPGSPVGFYIDDTPIGSSGNFAQATNFGLDLLPYDVERFEVLRGPQGTLYGAGAMGGLIKYVLVQADPSQFSAEVGAEGSYIDHSSGVGHAGRAAVNLPLIKDTLAVRLSGFDQEDQGYVDNVRLGLNDVNEVHQYGGRLALTWLPMDGLKVNLNALLYRLQADDTAQVRLDDITYSPVPGGALLATGTPVDGRLGNSFAFQEPFGKQINYFSSTVNYDFGPATFTSATSYSHTNTHWPLDLTDAYTSLPSAFGLIPGPAIASDNEVLLLNKFTQEFRFASPTGQTLEWLGGVFFTHESSNISELVNVYDDDYQPIPGPAGSGFDPLATVNIASTYKEYAGFGDLTWNIDPQLAVTGGLRWAHNSQTFDQVSDLPLFGGAVNGPGTSSESVVTWMVDADYHFTQHTMGYVRVATGYRPGGPNPEINGVIPPPVGSDRLTNYELGLKSTFLDGRAQLNAALFDIQWQKIQLSVEQDGQSNFANGGNAYSRGLELDGIVLPVQGVRLGYNATYTKAELTSVVAGAPPFILGYQLPDVPKWAVGVTADYQWTMTSQWQANAGVGAHYVSSEWVNTVTAPVPGEAPNLRNPAYTTLELHTGLTSSRYSVNLFVHNLTNKLVYLQAAATTNALTQTNVLEAVPLQPRTIGISVDAKF